MPKYTINGKTITSERPLTEAELEELAASFKPAGPEDIPSGGYIGTPGPAAPQMSATERMIQNALAGAAAVPPLAAGARILQAATQGSKLAPYLANLAKAVVPQSGKALATEGVIGAVGGAVGGELGQAVAQKAGEQYRPLGEIAGGVVGGYGANTLFRTVPEIAASVLRTGPSVGGVDEASQMLGSIRARTRLSQAMEANPSLAGNLAEAQRIEQELGVRLPVTSASKGDTTLQGMAQSVTARGENAAFTAMLKNQEEEALKALAQARRNMATSSDRVAAAAEMEAAKVRAENLRRERVFAEQQASRQERIDSIDDRISELTYGSLAVSDGAEQLGTRVSNLLAAKEKAVKAEFRPQYDNLLSDAKKQDLSMPSEAVAALHKYVKSSRAEDVFAKFPQLYAQINRILDPKSGPISSKFAEKYPNLVKSVEGTYTPANIDDVDSLKRAINKALGETKDADQARLLGELKRQFDNALGTMDQEFVSNYKALDAAYAEKVGLPFSEQGVLRVNRARFVEDTVPQLTTKPSAVRQILAASDNSPEALKVIEDAFLMKISNTAGIVSPDGILNQQQLLRFLNKNKETIDQVPGLRQRLETLASDVKGLKDTRASLIEEQKNAAVAKLESVWDKAQGSSGGFQGYVARAINNPDALADLMRTAATDKSLQRGLKAAILDIGLDKPNKLDFFTDNEKTINALFGKEHAQRVRMLFDASERLQSFPLVSKINPSITQQTEFQRATGSRPEQVASEARNQIISPFRAMANILSRFVQNRASKSEEAEIKEFLANPRAVADAAALIAELEKKGGGALSKVKDLGVRLSKNAASSALFGGLASVVPGELGLTEREPITEFE